MSPPSHKHFRLFFQNFRCLGLAAGRDLLGDLNRNIVDTYFPPQGVEDMAKGYLRRMVEVPGVPLPVDDLIVPLEICERRLFANILDPNSKPVLPTT